MSFRLDAQHLQTQVFISPNTSVPSSVFSVSTCFPTEGQLPGSNSLELKPPSGSLYHSMQNKELSPRLRPDRTLADL